MHSHDVNTADGTVTASLTFTKKGKRAGSAEMRVTVYDASGNPVAAATGGSPVELSFSGLTGVYTFEVTGPARTAYVLEVTHMAI